MTEFIINEPGWKRWLLPDGIHVINAVIQGDYVRWTIFHRLHPESPKQSMEIKLDHPKYEDLWVGFQELANKKYPRQLRHRGSPMNESELNTINSTDSAVEALRRKP